MIFEHETPPFAPVSMPTEPSEASGLIDQQPQPLSAEEIKQTAENLRRLPKGFLPFEVFNAVAEKVTTPTIDVVPLRISNGRMEVFMLRRPGDDPYWPGQWHVPGTVLRSTDKAGDFSSGLDRLFKSKDETEGTITPTSAPKYVTTKFWDVARGRELDTVHYVPVEATSDQLPGQFFPVDELPDDTIEHHKIIIQEAAEAYKRDMQQSVE